MASGLPQPLDYDIIKAGWTYQYHRADPLYPFGHGLSYTKFAYSDLRLSSETLAQDGAVDVSMTLTNTGTRPGSEVVQLYVRALNARYEAPRLRLTDFRKVALPPGGSRELTFRLPAEHLAHWDVASGAFTVDPGGYEVLVGRSAGGITLTAPVTVSGPAPAPRIVVDRRTSAVDFDDHTGITLLDATRTTGDAVAPANLDQPATLLFRSIDLSGAIRIEAEVTGAGPGQLEFLAGDRLLAEISVPFTGSRYAWTTVPGDLKTSSDGVHDLQVNLRGDVRLAAFRFGSARLRPPPEPSDQNLPFL
ncbi:fibronectin type III-like domain-contianing protein [Nonomuraea sp. CA-141351]|uniref:fibronectin type III-like domain-contianing protein n=1 Tax=Nonomuraea sp. CA-141351 TaxID=3239996 RepID=UPI003D8F571D